MSSRRTTSVTETRAEIRRLERGTSGPQQSRLTALRMIKDRPDASLGEIADAIGMSVATVERWWAMYRKGGIDSLVETKQTGGYRPSKVSNAIVDQIMRKRAYGELASQSDVRQWLETEHGITISRSGVAYLLKTRQTDQKSASRKPGRQTTHSDSGGGSRSRPKEPVSAIRTASRAKAWGGAGDTDILPDSTLLMAVLNTMPQQFDHSGWVGELREMLMPLLPDVDRISVDINLLCKLREPETYAPDIVISQTLGIADDDRVDVDALNAGFPIAESALARWASQGVDMSQFHPVVWREYYLEGTAYVGSLFFWRSRRSAPIPESTLALIDRLEPLIIFLLSDAVVRYDYAHPYYRVYHDILRTVSAESKLSMQERRVLNLRLMGEPYKAIASQLNVSQNAVRKHMTSVHRKTGTHSTVQLFAKYFTPRLAMRAKPLT